MSIHQFINKYGIRPADAIVLQKRFFGMVDHFVIYVGMIELKHAFVANYTEGVKVIPLDELERFLTALEPVKIDRYPGREDERPKAVKRAFSQLGKKAYNYIANNCEHFKNFVHYGIRKSTQVQKAGAVIVLGGLGVTLIGADKKNDGVTAAGVFIILIGIIVALLGAPDSQMKTNKS